MDHITSVCAENQGDNGEEHDDYYHHQDDPIPTVSILVDSGDSAVMQMVQGDRDVFKAKLEESTAGRRQTVKNDFECEQNDEQRENGVAKVVRCPACEVCRLSGNVFLFCTHTLHQWK